MAAESQRADLGTAQRRGAAILDVRGSLRHPEPVVAPRDCFVVDEVGELVGLPRLFGADRPVRCLLLRAASRLRRLCALLLPSCAPLRRPHPASAFASAWAFRRLPLFELGALLLERCGARPSGAAPLSAGSGVGSASRQPEPAREWVQARVPARLREPGRAAAPAPGAALGRRDLGSGAGVGSGGADSGAGAVCSVGAGVGSCALSAGVGWSSWVLPVGWASSAGCSESTTRGALGLDDRRCPATPMRILANSLTGTRSTAIASTGVRLDGSAHADADDRDERSARHARQWRP
jgi:hypothetical protein